MSTRELHTDSFVVAAQLLRVISAPKSIVEGVYMSLESLSLHLQRL
jgi:hypothetical protein